MNNNIKNFFLSFACLVFLPFGIAHAQVTYQTIVLEGDAADGTGGTFFALNAAPLINDSGKVAILAGADLQGSPGNMTFSTGIWAGTAGNLNKVMIIGESAPDTTGLIFTTTLRDFTLSDNGDVGAFHILGTTTSLVTDSVYRGTAGNYSLLAQENDLPGNSIRNKVQFFTDGSAAFIATDTANKKEMWFAKGFDQNQVLNKVAEVAPGVNAPGTTSSFIDILGVFGNKTGGIVFKGLLGSGSTHDRGLWTATASGATLLAREGDLAPGPGSDTYVAWVTQSIADNGDVAFVADLASGDRTVIAGPPNSLEVIAKEGGSAPVPGVPDAVFTASVGRNLQMNGLGETIFASTISGTGITASNREGIFSDSVNDVLSLLVQSGDSAPGTGSEVFFNFDPAVLNNLGQVAFTATTDMGTKGLWAIDGNNFLQMIAVTGALFDVGGGDMRTILGIAFAFRTPSQRGALTNQGLLAFQLSFTDGTAGIFTAQLQAVPVPAAVWLFGSGLLGLVGLARRKKVT